MILYSGRVVHDTNFFTDCPSVKLMKQERMWTTHDDIQIILRGSMTDIHTKTTAKMCETLV